MRWTLKLGLYGVAVVGVFAVATIAIPAMWVAGLGASAYRKLTT